MGMRDAVKRYVEAAQGLSEMSRERAERVARGLVGGGIIGPNQMRDVATDLMRRSRENRERLADAVARELRRQISRLGLATKDDIERLLHRVRALEGVAPAKTGTAKARTPKARTPKARKPAARKPAVRKASASKPTARKPAARKPSGRARRRPASGR